MHARIALEDPAEIQKVGKQYACCQDGDCKGGSAGEFTSHTLREYTCAAPVGRASTRSAASRNPSFAIVRPAQKERPFHNIWDRRLGEFVGSVVLCGSSPRRASVSPSPHSG